MAAAVLLVDDERFARTVYAEYLRSAGYEVELADGAEAALVQLAYRRFDVLVTDVILPGARDGLELLDAAKQLDPAIAVIVITALDEVGPAVRAMKSGASDYLVKPVAPEALQLAVHRSLATRALLAENESLRAHMQLFETCQRLTATLDKDKLVPMALAALAAGTGTGDGDGEAALLEPAAGGGYALAGAHGLAPDAAAALAEAVGPALARLDPAHPAVVPLPGAGRALLLPVADAHGLLGAAAAVIRGELPAPRAEGAAFLCRHLALALRNLGRLKQVEHLAYLDDLTQLYNTRYLDLVLARELGGTRPFTVLFMDLDHFKLVNDEHGHLSGSRLLVEVGRVLKSCVREEDVLVRYGGDEYVALLLGIDSGGGLKVAERVRRSVEDHLFLAREGARVRITASIGLASFPEHARDRAGLLDLADRAMYRGKRTTRNVVYIASTDLPPVPAGERLT